MSKLKTPEEKKAASLVLDNRNVYGENSKSSRRAIPLRKQLSHQAIRRASSTLSRLHGEQDEDTIVATESRVLSAEVAADRARFRKRPDEPLGKILKAKLTDEKPNFSRKRK